MGDNGSVHIGIILKGSTRMISESIIDSRLIIRHISPIYQDTFQSFAFRSGDF